jgi:protein O-GlcNAc transferase
MKMVTTLWNQLEILSLKNKKKNKSAWQAGAATGKSTQQRTMDIDVAINFAIQHHQAGNLDTAGNIYRQILQLQPGNPTALHLLGVIAYQQKKFDTAITLIGRALEQKPDFVDAHSNLGNVFREMGRLNEAETSYRKALAINGGFAMAHYNLGNILMTKRKFDEAAASFNRAITSSPNLAEAHINLGISYKELGRLDDAEGCYRKALFIRPDSPIAHFNLGNALAGKGRLDDAAASYERALARKPDYPEARLNLGNVLRDLGRLDEAISCYRQALEKDPKNAEACLNIGAVLRDLGKPGEAEEWYRTALDLNPDDAIALFNMGNALRDQGKPEEAVAGYKRALALSPDCTAIYINLGNILRDMGNPEEAVAVYRKALEMEPESAETLINLGNAFKKMEKLDEAAAVYEQALQLRPDMAEAHYNLGTVFQDQCRMEEAVSCYRRVLALKEDHTTAHSNLLMNIQYDPAFTPEALLEEARAWERIQLEGIRIIPPPLNNPDPERRLRVGYVSGDLRRHPVGYFLDAVLASHDTSRMEVFCYANQSFSDGLTLRLQQSACQWRDIFGKTDEAVADLIREDGIDILVDLAGHTARNRLLVFGRKPAPVQATWAGYVGATGLSAMDYLISDRHETPEGTDHWYGETVMRLPDCYVCYSPPEYAPSVAPLPARGNGFVTFGCFNNLAKINPGVVKLWTKLLREIPDARLLLVTKALGNRTVRGRYREMFAECGVSERVDFSGMVPHPELLARYGEVDIALDPFPYSGGLTTLESLWMGVPVITLGGDRFAARHSLSHLSAVGLPELIASDEDGYCAIATDLARDLPRLEALRSGLRERMAASPLCDGPRFTRNLEDAYRTMWRRWCNGKSPGK